MLMSKWNVPCLGSPEFEGQLIENKPYPIYKRIEPFTVDVETGEVLNPTKFYKLVKVGEKDLQEEIQSFKDDCDLYKILEKVAMSTNVITGNENELNSKKGFYGDLSDVPSGINDLNQYFKDSENMLGQFDKDTALDILGDKPVDEIVRNLNIKDNVKDGNENEEA